MNIRYPLYEGVYRILTLIGLFYIVLRHRGDAYKSVGRKMGKTEGEAGTTHQSPKAEKRGKRTDSRNQSRKNGRDDTENGGKPQGRHANGKGKTVICRVGSERSPCPRLRYPLMGQEEDFVWKTPGGVTHWDIITRQNIPRQIFSLTLYYAS